MRASLPPGRQRYLDRRPTTRDLALALSTVIQQRRYRYSDQLTAAEGLAAEYAVNEGWIVRSIVNGREAYLRRAA